MKKKNIRCTITCSFLDVLLLSECVCKAPLRNAGSGFRVGTCTRQEE